VVALTPFTSTASWKQSEKMAQFRPEASSFRTLNGRVSAREVAVTEVMTDNERNHSRGLHRESGGPITCNILDNRTQSSLMYEGLYLFT